MNSSPSLRNRADDEYLGILFHPVNLVQKISVLRVSQTSIFKITMRPVDWGFVSDWTKGFGFDELGGWRVLLL